MNQLSAHFSKETLALRNEIEQLKNSIEKELEGIDRIFDVDIESFYTLFRDSVIQLQIETQPLCTQYADSLRLILAQLDNRLQSINNPVSFVKPVDVTEALNNAHDQLVNIIEENNSHTSRLEANKRSAQNGLRLFEIRNFINTIDYENSLKDIQTLEKKQTNASQMKLQQN